jgi:hypothetical protein
MPFNYGSDKRYDILNVRIITKRQVHIGSGTKCEEIVFKDDYYWQLPSDKGEINVIYGNKRTLCAYN